MTPEQFDALYSLLNTMNNNICVLNENLNNNYGNIIQEIQAVNDVLNGIESTLSHLPYWYESLHITLFILNPAVWR